MKFFEYHYDTKFEADEDYKNNQYYIALSALWTLTAPVPSWDATSV
jgi:hypothetical protein